MEAEDQDKLYMDLEEEEEREGKPKPGRGRGKGRGGGEREKVARAEEAKGKVARIVRKMPRTRMFQTKTKRRSRNLNTGSSKPEEAGCTVPWTCKASTKRLWQMKVHPQKRAKHCPPQSKKSPVKKKKKHIEKSPSKASPSKPSPTLHRTKRRRDILRKKSFAEKKQGDKDNEQDTGNEEGSNKAREEGKGQAKAKAKTKAKTKVSAAKAVDETVPEAEPEGSAPKKNPEKNPMKKPWSRACYTLLLLWGLLSCVNLRSFFLDATIFLRAGTPKVHCAVSGVFQYLFSCIKSPDEFFQKKKLQETTNGK